MKKKLVLKTETIRQMQPRELSHVAGGTSYNSYCLNGCLVLNTNIVGGLPSMVYSRCGDTTGDIIRDPADQIRH